MDQSWSVKNFEPRGAKNRLLIDFFFFGHVTVLDCWRYTLKWVKTAHLPVKFLHFDVGLLTSVSSSELYLMFEGGNNRELKCRRCTTRGCPAAVSDWGVSFPRCQKREGLKSIVLEAGSAGTEGRSKQSEVKSMIQGDEGWWKQSTETEGWTEGGRGDGCGRDKAFALKAKRGHQRKTHDQNQGWIIEYEECIWKTIKRGCDPARSDCRTTAEAKWLKGRSKRRNTETV